MFATMTFDVPTLLAVLLAQHYLSSLLWDSWLDQRLSDWFENRRSNAVVPGTPQLFRWIRRRIQLRFWIYLGILVLLVVGSAARYAITKIYLNDKNWEHVLFAVQLTFALALFLGTALMLLKGREDFMVASRIATLRDYVPEWADFDDVRSFISASGYNAMVTICILITVASTCLL